MKNKLALFCMFVTLSALCFSQENARTSGQPIGGIIVKGGKSPGGSNIIVSLGGGKNSPVSTTKEGVNLNNVNIFSGSIYSPLFRKGWDGTVKGGNIADYTIGINVTGQYGTGNNSYNTSSLDIYNIRGQASAPTLDVRNPDGSKITAYSFETGLQANFSQGNFTISPILNAGFMSLSQNGYDIIQTSSVNGATDEYKIFGQTKVKTTGMVIVPKLRISYFPGRVGLWIEGNYTSGSSINSKVSSFAPSGKADAKGQYSIDQIITGTQNTEMRNTTFRSFGVVAGICIAIGKKPPVSSVGNLSGGGGGAAAASYAATGMVVQTGNDQTGQGNPLPVDHAINTKGTGATNGRMMQNESCGQVSQKTIQPDGTVNEMTFACPNDAIQYNERMSMNVTVPKQTQGTTFGEKVIQPVVTDPEPVDHSINTKGTGATNGKTIKAPEPESDVKIKTKSNIKND